MPTRTLLQPLGAMHAATPVMRAAEVFEAVLGAIWEDSNHSVDAVSAVYQRVACH